MVKVPEMTGVDLERQWSGVQWAERPFSHHRPDAPTLLPETPRTLELGGRERPSANRLNLAAVCEDQLQLFWIFGVKKRERARAGRLTHALRAAGLTAGPRVPQAADTAAEERRRGRPQSRAAKPRQKRSSRLLVQGREGRT